MQYREPFFSSFSIKILLCKILKNGKFYGIILTDTKNINIMLAQRKKWREKLCMENG